MLPEIGVILLCLLHGLEPGHGWPVAALYSLKKPNKYAFGLASSAIIVFFHFISAIAVVLLFIFLNSKVDLSAQWIRYAAAALLLFMAYRFWTNHTHTHQQPVQSLWNIAAFAFVLGFAHE